MRRAALGDLANPFGCRRDLSGARGCQAGPRPAAGGMLAQTSNIGQYNRNVFAVIPEVGLNLRVQLTPNLAGRVGHAFIFLRNAVRPGAQGDPAFDCTAPASGRRA